MENLDLQFYKFDNLNSLSRLNNLKSYIWIYNETKNIIIAWFVVNSPFLKNEAIKFFSKYIDSANYIWKILEKDTNYFVALIDDSNKTVIYKDNGSAKTIFEEFNKVLRNNYSHLRDEKLKLDNLDDLSNVFRENQKTSNVRKKVEEKKLSYEESLTNVKNDPVYAEEFIKEVNEEGIGLNEKITKDIIITSAVNTLINKVEKSSIEELLRLRSFAEKIEYPYIIQLQQKLKENIKVVSFLQKEEILSLLEKIISNNWKHKIKKVSNNILKTNFGIIDVKDDLIYLTIKENLLSKIKPDLETYKDYIKNIQ